MHLFQTLFSDAFIRALGWTVLHSLWQGMLIALILAGSMLLLQKRSARLRYRLSAASLLAILGGSILTFAWLFESPVKGATERTIIVNGNTSQLLADGQSSSPLLQWLHQCSAYFEAHLPLIVTIWILGLAFFLLRMLGGLAYVEYLKTRAVAPLTAHWQRRFEQLRQQLGMRQSIAILESGVAQVPMVLGWLKPVILIPVATLNALSPEQVEAVIAHELAHIYRRDYLFNILQSLIEALYYFNPAVWWISAYVRMERENCCDDIALELCGNSLDYAKALMQIEEAGQQQAHMAMALARNGKGQLLSRVKRILNQPQNKIMMMEKFTATAMLLAVLLFFSVSAVQPDQKDTARSNYEAAPMFNLPERTQPQMSVMTIDSLPKGLIQIRADHDGKKVDAELKDGNITRLNIDDKAIPEADYPEYEGMLEEMLSSIPPPPPAPPAPPAPNAIPAPPAPPAPNAVPAPPAAPKIKRVEVRKEKGKAGKEKRLIIIDKEEESEVIELAPGQDHIRLIDGDEEIIIRGDQQIDVRHIEEGLGNGEERRIYRLEMENIMGEEELEVIINEAHEEAAQALEGMDFDFDIDMDSVFSDEFKREFKDIKIVVPNELSWTHTIPKSDFEFRDMPMWNTRGMKSSIEKQMLRDGFIEDTDDYKFVLKGNGVLRINGKRMQEGVFERYKRIYEREAGMKLEDGDEVKINR